jgi:DNA-binding CsgD family transcriptional regulator
MPCRAAGVALRGGSAPWRRTKARFPSHSPEGIVTRPMRPLAIEALTTRSRAVALQAAQRADGSLDKIVAGLYGRGDLRLALELAGTPAAGPLALRCAVRAALALGDYGAALDAANALAATGDAFALPLRAYAVARRHAPEAALAELQTLQSHPDGDVAAEAAYRLALLAWNDGATGADTFDLVARAAETASGESLCRLQTMAGWLEVRRGRYAVGARHFRSALATYAQAELHDEWLRQRVLQAASSLAMEMLDFDVLRGLDVEHERLGHETREPAFWVTQNFGWLALLGGRRAAALGLFQRAGALAETPALRAAAEVNVAAYHRTGGALDAARDHLALARTHLRRQTWRIANADERVTLLDYAIEAYELDPFTAGEMLTLFLSSELRKTSNLAFENDRRVGAVELLARGVLEGIHGRPDAARPLLERCAAECNALGYRYKEALALSLLARISGDQAYADASRRVARAAPQSWLAAPAGSDVPPAQPAVAVALGAAAQRVMRAICEGKTSREIARELGKSVHTVRNQTLSVYRVLGVHTRAALVAECARLGLLEAHEEGQPLASERLPRKRIGA